MSEGKIGDAPEFTRSEGVRLVGYARVGVAPQTLHTQVNALKGAGCDQVFQDVASGTKAARKGLEAALSYLRPGDTLVVLKLDRLGQSLSHLVQVVDDLRHKRIGFRSLTDLGIDTTSPTGTQVNHMFAALASFERELIRERTKPGLLAAAAQGRRGGRRPSVTPGKLEEAQKLIDEKGLSVRDAAAEIRVGKTALYAALRAAAERDLSEK